MESFEQFRLGGPQRQSRASQRSMASPVDALDDHPRNPQRRRSSSNVRTIRPQPASLNGRPQLRGRHPWPKNIREIIRETERENPTWGEERIPTSRAAAPGNLRDDTNGVVACEFYRRSCTPRCIRGRASGPKG